MGWTRPLKVGDGVCEWSLLTCDTWAHGCEAWMGVVDDIHPGSSFARVCVCLSISPSPAAYQPALQVDSRDRIWLCYSSSIRLASEMVASRSLGGAKASAAPLNIGDVIKLPKSVFAMFQMWGATFVLKCVWWFLSSEHRQVSSKAKDHHAPRPFTSHPSPLTATAATT